MKIIIRQFDPIPDSGLIFDSYPKGVFYGAAVTLTKDKPQWMKSFYEVVKEQLAKCEVRIACTEDDPSTILGYSIISKTGILHFVYVKSDFRNKKIGTLLTKGKYSNIDPSTLTKVGASIFSKLNKGESIGTDTNTKEE